MNVNSKKIYVFYFDILHERVKMGACIYSTMAILYLAFIESVINILDVMIHACSQYIDTCSFVYVPSLRVVSWLGFNDK